MATSYTLVLSDGSFDQFVNEDVSVVDHGLTFTGRGVVDYTKARNENILHIAENFAFTVPPTNPLIGQLWWDTNVNALKAFDGATFVSVSADDFITSGTYNVNDLTGAIVLPKDGGGQVDIANAASEANLNNHISVDDPAHTAAAISFVAGGSIPSNTAQNAILDVNTNIANHVADTVDAHDASAIESVAVGSVTSTNVQGALQEVEDEIDVVQSTVTLNNTNINIHIADASGAHEASAISFIPGVSGLVSTDVQAAIDEIFASAGSPGSLETVRAIPSSTQAIGPGATKILFQVVNSGNTEGQWNTGTSRYTAAFDQEVNISFAAGIGMLPNTAGFYEIRRNGVAIRNHQISNFGNDSGGSDVDIAESHEINIKTTLTTGQFIEFFISLPVANAIHATFAISEMVHAEFEVVRVL